MTCPNQRGQRCELRLFDSANTPSINKRQEGRTVNPSANAYTGSNPVPATLVSGCVPVGLVLNQLTLSTLCS